MILSSQPDNPIPPAAPIAATPQKGWLRDLKDSDKVALAILMLGVAITATATGAHLFVVFHGHIQEADMDRILSVIKDFFGVGTGLIGASLLALKLQPKNGGGTPPTQ